MATISERKKKILAAVVDEYVRTAEPVGSKAIAALPDVSFSSATIRNEMAELSEMGYLEQPHTSAGRIPSDKGYRFYVDQLMNDKVREVEEMKEVLLEREEKMENLLKQVAKKLAINTNYASMISAPSIHGNKLKFIQLSRVDENQLLAVVVIEGNVIKNKMIRLSEEISDETLLKLNLLLNTNLNGLNIESINLGIIQTMKSQAGIHSEIVDVVIDAVADAIKADEDLEIYTSGTTNIFKYPELSDSERASELISTFENKEDLNEFVQSTLSEEENTGIQVYIGEEVKMKSMKDCSVVTATYELEEGMRGTIGIIGPKRMDYEKVVGMLKNLKQQMSDLYKNDRKE